MWAFLVISSSDCTLLPELHWSHGILYFDMLYFKESHFFLHSLVSHDIHTILFALENPWLLVTVIIGNTLFTNIDGPIVNLIKHRKCLEIRCINIQFLVANQLRTLMSDLCSRDQRNSPLKKFQEGIWRSPWPYDAWAAEISRNKYPTYTNMGIGYDFCGTNANYRLWWPGLVSDRAGWRNILTTAYSLEIK